MVGGDDRDTRSGTAVIEDTITTGNPLAAFYCFFRYHLLVEDNLWKLLTYGVEETDYEESKELIVELVSETQYRHYFTTLLFDFLSN